MNGAGSGDDVFVAEGLGEVEGSGLVRIDDELDDASVVAEVDEDEAAVVAAGVDPAHDGCGLVGFEVLA